jgi:hypothetical protein
MTIPRFSKATKLHPICFTKKIVIQYVFSNKNRWQSEFKKVWGGTPIIIFKSRLQFKLAMESYLPTPIKKLFSKIRNDAISKNNFYAFGSEYLSCDSIDRVISLNRQMSNLVVNAYLNLLQTTVNSKVVMFGTFFWDYVIMEFNEPQNHFIRR